MKTRVMSIVSQTSNREWIAYAAVIVLLFVLYFILDLRLQSSYRALERERYYEEVAIDSLQSEISLADLQVYTLSALERIRPMAENLGLGMYEPAYKVMLATTKEDRK